MSNRSYRFEQCHSNPSKHARSVDGCTGSERCFSEGVRRSSMSVVGGTELTEVKSKRWIVVVVEGVGTRMMRRGEEKRRGVGPGGQGSWDWWWIAPSRG